MTGRIEAGTVKVGDEIEVVGLASGGVSRKSIVTGVEMFHRAMTQAQAGDNVGLLLRGIRKGDVERGQVRFSAQVCFFSPFSGFCVELKGRRGPAAARHSKGNVNRGQVRYLAAACLLLLLFSFHLYFF